MAEGAALLAAYLVVGADELKRDTAVRRLRSRVPSDMADFNLDELQGSQIEDPMTLVSSLETMPFCADFRLVIVHEADKLVKAVSEADGARVEQHRFCERGLTCVDVRQYADNRLPHRSPERCVLACGCNRLPGERLGQDVRASYCPVPGA